MKTKFDVLKYADYTFSEKLKANEMIAIRRELQTGNRLQTDQKEDQTLDDWIM